MNTPKPSALRAATALTLLLCAHPAQAELPPSVRAMIDAAIASGDAAKVSTVMDLARQVHPEDAAEIDQIAADFTAKQAAAKAQMEASKAEEKRAAGLFDNWSGEGQLGALVSTGNSSNTGLTAGLKLAREGADWTHKISALADFQRSSGVTTREQFLLAYEPNRQLSDRLFLYGLGQLERDRFQGFSSRIAASGGLGYKVLDTDTVKLSVNGGPAYRKTNFVGGGSDSALAGLASLDFDWRLSETVKISQDASAFVQSGNDTLLATTALEAGLSGALSLRLSYAVEYDSQPPVGAVSTDTLTRVSIIYGF